MTDQSKPDYAIYLEAARRLDIDYCQRERARYLELEELRASLNPGDDTQGPAKWPYEDAAKYRLKLHPLRSNEIASRLKHLDEREAAKQALIDAHDGGTEGDRVIYDFLDPEVVSRMVAMAEGITI